MSWNASAAAAAAAAGYLRKLNLRLVNLSHPELSQHLRQSEAHNESSLEHQSLLAELSFQYEVSIKSSREETIYKEEILSTKVLHYGTHYPQQVIAYAIEQGFVNERLPLFHLLLPEEGPFSR